MYSWFVFLCAALCLLAGGCASKSSSAPPSQPAEWKLFNDTGRSVIGLFILDNQVSGDGVQQVSFQHTRAYDQSNIGVFHRLWNTPPQAHEIMVLSAESLDCLTADFALTEREQAVEEKDIATGGTYSLYRIDKSAFDALLQVCPLLGEYTFSDIRPIIAPPFTPDAWRVAVNRRGNLSAITDQTIQQRWERETSCSWHVFNLPKMVEGSTERVELVPDKRMVCRESYTFTPKAVSAPKGREVK